MSSRSDLIALFLQQYFTNEPYSLTAISGDASFRRYFRVSTARQTYVLMDAPVPQEDCGRFVATQQSLAVAGLLVPQLLAKELDQGLLLLSDLGDQLLQPLLNEQTAVDWYRQALALLPKIRSIAATSAGPLPEFDQAFVLRELMICPEWFLGTHLQLELSEQDWALWQQAFSLLSDAAMQQPKAGMHRDYHSRNLMPQADGQLAVIDFQDIVLGPVSYDAVSLLKDCYVKWPPALVQQLAIEFYQQLQQRGELSSEVSEQTFLRWFDWMGLQRHIKVLGIFSRLYHRDNKAGYLPDLPRVLGYVLECCQRYPEFQPLALWLEQHVVPLLAPEY
ncbi:MULTISPECIES: aminoglycoside phosphotransferase family protein [Rheinheimera]|uniref:Aminoglycoside phosphotransferase family protein n=1 Tax=Rheinheimera marina TaxID=1774958 RepID=A0ABV9JP70_9GAMM